MSVELEVACAITSITVPTGEIAMIVLLLAFFFFFPVCEGIWLRVVGLY